MSGLLWCFMKNCCDGLRSIPEESPRKLPSRHQEGTLRGIRFEEKLPTATSQESVFLTRHKKDILKRIMTGIFLNQAKADNG